MTHGYRAALALESVILHRLLVHDALAVPLLPTLGMQLAPPAVGCVAYLGLAGRRHRTARSDSTGAPPPWSGGAACAAP